MKFEVEIIMQITTIKKLRKLVAVSEANHYSIM